MDPIYRALGRPDAPDGYGVKVADGLPEYVSKFAGELATELHGLGATTTQMTKIVDVLNKHSAAQIEAENDVTAADQAKVDDFVKSQWGENAEVMRKEVTNLLKEAAGPEFAALQEELAGNLGKSPILFKFLAGLVNARFEGKPMPAGAHGSGFAGAMSLADAQAAKNAFHADANKREAWTNRAHPGHTQAVAEMDRLNGIIVSARKAK